MIGAIEVPEGERQPIEPEGIGRNVEFTPSYRADMPKSLHMIQNPGGICRVAFNPLQ